MAACCSSRARSSSRALRTRIAFARFLICDRSSWHVTTSPVGRWVIRTAESVVLTPCPPGGDGGRRVAARAGADLDEDVLLVVRIPRQQEPLQLFLERRLPAGELVDLRLGELGELAVAALGEDVARLADAPEHIAVRGEALDDLDGVGMLLPEPGVLDGPAEDGGGGQRPGDLVGPLIDVAGPGQPHTGSAGPLPAC